VRLQNDLDRLHADPRIADNAGAELDNADAAVATLSRNARELDARSYEQGVYISDKLVHIAEASALARYAERRGEQLGAERERLLARGANVSETLPTAGDSRPMARARELTASARAGELLSMQDHLDGLESSVDSRGLVVRLGAYMFEPDRPTFTPTAERSLDSLARVMRDEPNSKASIEADATIAGDMAVARATATRDYLNARGVDVARLDINIRRRLGENGLVANNRGDAAHLNIVIRTDY
jgi:outer membrane protein OmpA-like peptidoglycan-associated protein